MTLPSELANLPAPTAIEEIDYEVRLAEFVSRLVSQMSAVGINYDVDQLEADPAKVLLEVSTYADTMLRARINDAVRANLLAYANGSDLDHLAQFYDVSRLYAETDDALRRRVVLAIQGRSTGGTEPRYKFVALTASPLVADAAIYTVGRDPTINVAVYSTAPDGVADPGLLALVDAALQDPAVRMVNDRIVVASAVQQVVPVTANIWLLPSAPTSALASIEAGLRAAWLAEGTLGRDITRSWLTAKLMQPTVHKVEIISPAADVVVPFNQAASIGTGTLTDKGRSF